MTALQREFDRLCEQCDLHDGISRGLLYGYNLACTNHGAESSTAIALWEQMERNNREWDFLLAAKGEVFAQMYASEATLAYGSCPECGILQHAYSGYENDLCAHCEGIDYAIPDCEVLEVSDYVELIGDRTCDGSAALDDDAPQTKTDFTRRLTVIDYWNAGLDSDWWKQLPLRTDRTLRDVHQYRMAAREVFGAGTYPVMMRIGHAGHAPWLRLLTREEVVNDAITEDATAMTTISQMQIWASQNIGGRHACGHIGEHMGYKLFEESGYDVRFTLQGQKNGDLRVIDPKTGQFWDVEVKTARQGKDKSWRFRILAQYKGIGGKTDFKHSDYLLLMPLLASGRAIPFLIPTMDLPPQLNTISIGGGHPEDYAGKYARYRVKGRLCLS